jgi:hypothetical protein
MSGSEMVRCSRVLHGKAGHHGMHLFETEAEELLGPGSLRFHLKKKETKNLPGKWMNRLN